nr:MAG TPA: Fibronectin type III protein [Bacteriophage sp.]
MWAGSNTASSAKFSVSKGGLITAKEGNIGGWILSSNKLTSDNYRTGMASSGTYRFWAGAGSGSTASNPIFTGSSFFYVTSTGEMKCKNAAINGEITADKGTIGGWTITSSGLQNSSGTIRLSTSSLKVGDNFSVSSTGKLTANNATITGRITANRGKIGGWTIDDDRISAGDTTLWDDGEIECYNLDANGGYIGGWSIEDGTLSAGSTYLYDTGVI